MSQIIAFFQWFFDNLPDFFMSDPIKYLLGFFFLGAAIRLVVKLFGGRYE